MKRLLMALLAVVIVLAVMDIAQAQGKGGGSNPGGGGNQPGGGGNQPGGKPGGGGSQPAPMPVPPGGGNQPGGGGNDPGQPPGGGGSDPGGGGNQPGVRPGGGGNQPGGRPKAVDPDVVSVVRTLRKLIWTLRQLKKQDDADPGKIEKVEEHIRKLIGWLDEHDVNWREMNNHEKCCLDPEVGKMIRAMEWLRNELKGLDPEKDKRKIAKILRKMHHIMKALRKMYIGGDDVPDDLKPPKGDGKCHGDRDKCRKHDGPCDCPKGDGDCPKGDGDCKGKCHGDGKDGCGGCPKGDGDCPKGDGDCPKGDGDCPRGDGDCPKGDGGCCPKPSK